jgi:hypothetical protein
VGIGFAALALFLGHAACGVYLHLKVGEYRGNQPPPKSERWNAEFYAAGVEPWLARYRRWHRRRNAVWLGCKIIRLV